MRQVNFFFPSQIQVNPTSINFQVEMKCGFEHDRWRVIGTKYRNGSQQTHMQEDMGESAQGFAGRQTLKEYFLSLRGGG